MIIKIMGQMEDKWQNDIYEYKYVNNCTACKWTNIPFKRLV